jgi:hypothetical protein
MKHETIKNDFFNQKVDGPSKSITLKQAIEMAVGRRTYMSKRLSPAGTICNGRIYASTGEYLFDSDINIFKSARPLETVAEAFGIDLFIFSEHGNDYYWKSSEPEMWQGGLEIDGEWIDHKAHPFTVAGPILEACAAKRHRQWMIDHGLIRRSVKEWWKSAVWHWKHAPTEFRFWVRAKDPNTDKPYPIKTKAYYIFRWLFCF